MEKFLKDNNTTTQAHQQTVITTVLSPINLTRATSQARAAQVGYNRDLAITICCACRARPDGP